MCFAFDLVPSQLYDFVWTVSYRDIKTKLKLRLGLEQAAALQGYKTLVSVISAVVGGGEKKDQTPRNMHQAEAQLRNVIGG